MINTDIGYSYNDLTLVPAVSSSIKSRSEIIPWDDNGNLPIFAAPMSAVVSTINRNEFISNGITPIIPRSESLYERETLMQEGIWVALSLKEFESIFINYEEIIIARDSKFNVCVDIANGHMQHLYELCLQAKQLAKKNQYELNIMTGNIANPETYRYIINTSINKHIRIVDYIRVGIGSGAGCITSSNTSVHYPMASLIDECNTIKNYYMQDFYPWDDEIEEYDEVCDPINYSEFVPKIIADGGIRNYSDVVTALALGADYVMIGSLFAKALESCGAKMFTNYKGEKEMCSAESAYELYEKGAQLYTRFYGMASADGQIAISGKKTKTAEGIVKMLPVEYKLYKWVENMDAYLRSAMSYCNCKTLKDFIGKQTLIVNSISEIQAVNK